MDEKKPDMGIIEVPSESGIKAEKKPKRSDEFLAELNAVCEKFSVSYIGVFMFRKQIDSSSRLASFIKIKPKMETETLRVIGYKLSGSEFIKAAEYMKRAAVREALNNEIETEYTETGDWEG